MGGLLVLLGDLMVGALLGQSPQFGAMTNRHADGLLLPDFEPSSLETFQTPVLELDLSPATVSGTNRLGLSVIEPLRLNLTSEPTSFPGVSPAQDLAPSDHPIEDAHFEPRFPENQMEPSQTLKRAWMQPVHQPIFRADPLSGLPVSPGFSTSRAIPHEIHGLPALPHPILPGPGHSRGLTSDPPRPGHSTPKRLSDCDLDHRPW